MSFSIFMPLDGLKKKSHISAQKKYSGLTDEELVQRSQLGEQSAFSEIALRYEPYILANCRSFVKNQEVAKDLTQEILIKLFLELPKFRLEAKLKTWVYAITYHTCVDYLRKNKKRIYETVSQQLSDSLPELLDEELEDLDTDKSLSLLEELLKQMTSEGRLILLMKYVEKQKIKDIQLALGVSESAIKMRLKRARSVLNELYLQYRKNSVRESRSD
jgi:RNA polymerase sigma-70 factor (ECF subfamily)